MPKCSAIKIPLHGGGAAACRQAGVGFAGLCEVICLLTISREVLR